MAGENKTFNTKVVGTIELPGSKEAQSIITSLVRLQKDLTKEFQNTANAARNAAELYAGSPGDAEKLKALKSSIAALGKELKDINAVGRGAALLKPDDIKLANEMSRKVAELSRAYKDLEKQKGIETGKFGLDSTKAKQAIQDLKDLEKASTAVNAAMALKGDKTGELTKYKQTIEANTQALIKHIDTLRNATKVEDAHVKALAANAAREAGIRKSRQKMQEDQDLAVRRAEMVGIAAQKKGLEDFLMWRQRAKDKASQDEYRAMLAAQEKEKKSQSEYLKWLQRERDKASQQEYKRFQAQQDLTYRQTNSASAQSQLARGRLDFSAQGRAAGAYNSQLLEQRTSLLANPAFQAQDQARRQRALDEQALKEVYQRAGVRPETAGMYRVAASDVNDQKRVQAAQNIVALQRQLVDMQQRGALTDAESLRIRTAITNAIAQEVQARNKAGNVQAQQNQAERNMARIGGAGGASLLAVQASLMANYSMLNGFTGSVRAAVTGSVELEAAMRNVQAVTATTYTEMAGLEQKIKEVASGTKFSSVEVANAALTLGQAGLSAKEVGEAIAPVAMLASAAGTNLAQAVDLVTSVIGVFDKKADDTADVANKITQAANSSKVSVDKLALGLQYAGNTAAQSGISFEETTAAMAAMANAGIKSGSTMGTGLRQFIVETQKPSEEFLKTIARLGLSMHDLDFKSHGLIGVARRLREAGFIASDAIKSFDVRGAAAFNALIANPDDMERQHRMLLDTKAGLAANEIQMDSLKAQATRLTTSMVNLASVGFGPTGKVLQDLAGGLATATQAASEHTNVVKVLGSVVAMTMVTAMTLYTASMVRGALGIIGISTAAVGAVSSMSLLTIAQAAVTRGAALWAGLRAAVVATGAAYTIAASQGVVASTLLGTAVAGVTSVLRAMWAVITGMSLSTGIGLVLAAVAAGYYLLRDSSEDARMEIDKMKASSVEAKAEFQKKADTIDSLNNRIAELTYKQSEAKTSQQDLITMGMSLNAQFGATGLHIDANTRSYGEMITKMKEVRTQMEALAMAKLRVAADETRKLEAVQTAEVQTQTKYIKTDGAVALNQALSDRYKKQVTPQQRDMLTRVQGDLSAGRTPDATSLEGVKVLLSELADRDRKSGLLQDRGVHLFDTFVKKIDPLVRASSDLQITKGESASIQSTIGNTIADKEYKNKPVTIEINGKPVNMTLGEATEQLGGNMRGKQLSSGVTGDPLKDYKAFYEMSAKELAQTSALEKVLKEDLASPDTNKEVITKQLTNLLARREEIKGAVFRAAQETAPLAEREYENQKIVNSANKGKKNRKEAAQAYLDQGKLDEEYQTRDIVDPVVKANKIASIRRASEQRAQNKLDREPQGRNKGNIDQVQERVLKINEAAELRAADADKADAGITQDLDLVSQLWDDGLEHLKKAREHALEAVRARQRNDKKKTWDPETLKQMQVVWAEEFRGVNADYDERMQQFSQSFKGFGSAAAKALRKMEDTINKQKKDLEDFKLAGEDKVYKESERLRQLELERDIGKKARNKTGSTTAFNYGTKDDTKNSKGTTIATDDNTVKTTIGPNGVTVSNSSQGSEYGVSGGSTAKTRSNLNAGNTVGNTVGTTLGEAGISSPLTGTLNQRIAQERIRVSQIELNINEEYLKRLGDSESGMIGELTKRANEALTAYEETQKTIKDLEGRRIKGETLTPEETQRLRLAQSSVQPQGAYVKEANTELRGAMVERRTARKENTDIQKVINENQKVSPVEINLDNMKTKMKEVVSTWRDSVAEMDSMKVMTDGMNGILGNVTGTLAGAFSGILTGTKSVKSAFSDMAAGIIKSMMDIMAQVVAMQAIKAFANYLGFGASLFGGNASSGVEGSATFVGPPAAATGGYINESGVLERVRKFAGGGPVNGGIQGRDSVPALLMPGEFVLKRSAVNAVGTDYLHSLNQETNRVVSSGSTSPKEPKDAPGSQGVVNVWVVTPDQQPNSTSPKDIVAVVSDDISRGGSVKKLIKQVMMNQI
jgi:TP901 family phage tail tape measure protein